jgi:hypothetical protein
MISRKDSGEEESTPTESQPLSIINPKKGRSYNWKR